MCSKLNFLLSRFSHIFTCCLAIFPTLESDFRFVLNQKIMTCGPVCQRLSCHAPRPYWSAWAVSSRHRARDKNCVPTGTVRRAPVRRCHNAILLRCQTPLLLHVQVAMSSPEPSSVARAPLSKRCLRRRLLCASWSNRCRWDQGRARPCCAIICRVVRATQNFSVPVGETRHSPLGLSLVQRHCS
jgi:hypothetical protein